MLFMSIFEIFRSSLFVWLSAFVLIVSSASLKEGSVIISSLSKLGINTGSGCWGISFPVIAAIKSLNPRSSWFDVPKSGSLLNSSKGSPCNDDSS